MHADGRPKNRGFGTKTAEPPSTFTAAGLEPGTKTAAVAMSAAGGDGRGGEALTAPLTEALPGKCVDDISDQGQSVLSPGS